MHCDLYCPVTHRCRISQEWRLVLSRPRKCCMVYGWSLHFQPRFSVTSKRATHQKVLVVEDVTVAVKLCHFTNFTISLRRLHLQQPKLILMLICGLSHIPVYVASFYDSTNVRTMLDAFCFHVVCPRMHPWLKFVNWICYKLLHAISPNLQLWCTSEKDEVLRFSGQKVNGPCHDKSKYGQKCTFWTLLSTQNIKCW